MDTHEDIVDLEARYRRMLRDPERDPERDAAQFGELSAAFAGHIADLDPERAEQVLALALEALGDPPAVEHRPLVAHLLCELSEVSGALRHVDVQFESLERERRLAMSILPIERTRLVELRRRTAAALLAAGRVGEGLTELVHAVDDVGEIDDDELFTELILDVITATRSLEIPDAIAASIERLLVNMRQGHPAQPRVLWCLIGVIALRLARDDREGARLYVGRLADAFSNTELPVAAYLVVGWSRLADGAFEAALDAFDAAGDVVVHDPRTRFLLTAGYGEAAYLSGRSGEAVAALAEAASYSVGDVRTLARCHELLAEIAIAEQRPGDAVEQLQMTRRYEHQLRRYAAGHGSGRVIDLRDRRVRTLEQIIEDRTVELEQALVDLRDLSRNSGVDPLTGLVNRHRVGEVLAERLAVHDTVAVLTVGIDRFVRINESLGHTTGDALLVEMARRLEHVLDAADVVARWGGDEFVVLLCGVRDDGAAVLLAEVIRQRLCVPWVGGGDAPLVPSVTIGVAVSGDAGADPETLLRQADLALDQAKSKGKGRVGVFGDSLGAASRRRFDAELLVRSALENDWFELYYQPVYSNVTGRPTAAEALLRISHPELGLLPPAAFLDVVEETGLAVPVGEWVFGRACRALAAWQRLGRWFRLSVNVSVGQIDQRLPNVVAAALHDAGASADGLVIELTEHALLEADDTQVAAMTAIRDTGVRIALDDFGTAYSSLTHLRRFPVDYVKIDRSFVAGMCHNPQDEAIIRAVVDLSRSFGFRVVAEGIETADQLDAQRQIGCHAAQGYLIGRPMPEAAFTDLLTGLPMVDALMSSVFAAF